MQNDRDYSKLDLLPLFGVVKIFLELEIKITGNYNFIQLNEITNVNNLMYRCLQY